MFFNQRTFIFLSIIIVAIAGVAAPETLNYRSYVFCTLYMNLFSYEDGTELTVYDSEDTLYSGVLDKGEHVLILLPEPYIGAFELAGSKKFSVLTGHAPKSGYYAIDQNGSGLSTEFYSYVPPKTWSYHGYQKFVVFAYEDGTEIIVECADPNQIYHEVVTDFALDKGENWSSEDLSGEYVHVTSNKPVSALSCYDTGYFVPSANGNWPETSMCAYI